MAEEQKLAQQIQEYLELRPQAGDTLEGIANWWLLRQQVNESVEEIKRALAILKTRNVIVEQKMAGRTIYVASRRNDDRQRSV
jgi:hypothetical protein